MRYATLYIRLSVLLCVVLSFLLGWWPLALCAVVFSIAAGESFLGIFAALCVDLVWGVPTGRFHWLVAPVTTLSVFLWVTRTTLEPYVRQKASSML